MGSFEQFTIRHAKNRFDALFPSDAQVRQQKHHFATDLDRVDNDRVEGHAQGHFHSKLSKQTGYHILRKAFYDEFVKHGRMNRSFAPLCT